MPIPEFGKLEAVPIGSVWSHEAQEFTPWLAENLDLLGESVGLHLGLVRTEAYAFGGYADILAEDEVGDKVIIENQLAQTDNDHFARLLGYAADHNARTIIWVAPEFTDAHKRVLDWLNRAWTGRIELHGVEVSAVRIGESEPAPIFRSVVQPHARLEKAPTTTLSPTVNRHTYYSVFYAPLNERLCDRGIVPISPRNGGWVSRYRTYPSGYEGMFYMLIHDEDDELATVGFRVREANRPLFDALHEDKEQIERELAEIPLEWYEDWDIPCVCMTTEAHYGDPEGLQERTREWMFESLLRLREVIEPRLQKIMASTQNEAESLQGEETVDDPEVSQ